MKRQSACGSGVGLWGCRAGWGAAALGCGLAALLSLSAPAAELSLQLPLGRKAYQTNERIDFAVVRSAAEALPAADLTMTVSGQDGSRMTFTFALPAVAVVSTNAARRTDHLHLNGWLLRPGNYGVEVAAHGATARADIEVYTHLRKSTFVNGDWGGGARGPEQAVMGEDSLGFNLSYFGYGGLSADDMIRGGINLMRCCTMGGAHQMDIRMECDWSDPYVLQGGAARVTREALSDRTCPNCIGVHFYDEPGLTWWTHPETKEMTPHNIPAQMFSYQAAFGRALPTYTQVTPDKADLVAQWYDWGRWKMAFMEAAWGYSAFGVNQVRADFIPATQTVYGWNAYADGYYFNIARQLPVISGHGGYDDLGSGYLYTSYVYEFGRARDLSRPNWYLPEWYEGMPSDRFRLEHYLTFMNHANGLLKPPGQKIHRPTQCTSANGNVEANLLMLRLGTIYDTMPVTRPPVAALYSLSQCLYAQVQSGMKDNYTGGGQSAKLHILYLASKLNQIPFQPIVEEDILDGTLHAQHKAVILAGIDSLAPNVVAGLKSFLAAGGTVIETDDCKVQIAGATKLGAAVDSSLDEKIGAAWKAQDFATIGKLGTTWNYLQAAAPLSKALGAKLGAVGIKPVFGCDNQGIAAARQTLGDVEYLFAANITTDPAVAGKNTIMPTVATISIPDDGRPVYDAVLAMPEKAFEKKNGALAAAFRFGSGQMKVFARTARPIGGVQVATPSVVRDYTLDKAPVSLRIGAVVQDDRGGVVSGPIPLEIRVVDALGVSRFALYRAADRGVFRMELPLAANDAVGTWTVRVRELLSGKESQSEFALATPAVCPAVAGATARAVCFGNDRDNIFRFFRTHRAVTIVTGKSDYNGAAAERLVASLKPWRIDCTVVAAADVNKPLTLTADEARTWCGLSGGTRKPEDANIQNTGFNVQGDVLLLGTPEDNPLIAFALRERFLPYKPDPKDFPGRGRGMLAWQRDAVGYEQESVALIAYDADGMSEAVGSLYEAAAGLNPMSAMDPPLGGAVTPAMQAPAKDPAAVVAWQAVLPDRAAAFTALSDGTVLVLAEDGTLEKLDAAGKAQWTATIAGGERWELAAAADGSLIAVGATHGVVGLNGKGKEVFNVPFQFAAPGQEGKPTSPPTSVAVAPDGSAVAACALNGNLVILTPKGRIVSAAGAVTPAEYSQWQADLKVWQAGAAQRDAENKAYKEAADKYKTDKAAWDKAPQKDRGPKPEEPKRPPQAPQPQQPKRDAYQAVAFSPDGKIVLALTAKGGNVLNAADGKAITNCTGVAGLMTPVAAGDKLLVTNGKDLIELLAPATGTAVSHTALPRIQTNVAEVEKDPKKKPEFLPPDAVVGLVPAGEGAVVASEFDGSVRMFKALTGTPADQVAWTQSVTRRLCKVLAGRANGVAVGYWGGLVRVLGMDGKVQAAQTFDQDIAGLAWAGDTLIVGLADGRVVGLSVK